MFHFPVAPAFEGMHRQQNEQFWSRLLDQILSPAECPIGTNFIERFNPPQYGVVMLDNIPYGVTRAEVRQFFGRSSDLVPDCPIHIIMERSTGKTMNCFVEFTSRQAAREAVDRIHRTNDAGQGARMANRHVDVVLSSQDELLRAMFPKAKCIKWIGGRPVQVPKHPDEGWSTGFVGFLTDEELFCVLRHAKEPHRSAFATKVPQRTYESITSTIWKFPWFATTMYTVHARNKLFETLRDMIELLRDRVQASRQTVGLEFRLLAELLRAGLCCPAFNPRMKWDLTFMAGDQAQLHLVCHDDVPGTRSLDWGRRSDEHPRRQYPYGNHRYVWTDAASREKKFSEAMAYEMQVLRNILVTGYNITHPSRQAPPLPMTATQRTIQRGDRSGDDNQPHLSSGESTPRAGLQQFQRGVSLALPYEPLRPRVEYPSHGPNPFVVPTAPGSGVGHGQLHLRDPPGPQGSQSSQGRGGRGQFGPGTGHRY
ncbi:hypothetical protein N7462_001085 [Penicillium macrosclerotiorum]|uniref:uncharacterized protein n=1 Tax=Penicillium macrosclerotiorum TaxID=303699 RepID=UPI002549075F|nr:uncharacterized protein N7462_001085 [Penicillium macrosclerotiorum]KAJ5699080.1 hypothetical protein N7462_001085 [Penicillium macrosclerotiorum]